MNNVFQSRKRRRFIFNTQHLFSEPISVRVQQALCLVLYLFYIWNSNRQIRSGQWQVSERKERTAVGVFIGGNILSFLARYNIILSVIFRQSWEVDPLNITPTLSLSRLTRSLKVCFVIKSWSRFITVNLSYHYNTTDSTNLISHTMSTTVRQSRHFRLMWLVHKHVVGYKFAAVTWPCLNCQIYTPQQQSIMCWDVSRQFPT